MDKARMGGFAAIIVAAATAAACGGSQGGNQAKSPLDVGAVGTSGAARCSFKSSATPIGQTSSGSPLALAKVGGKRVAYVADEDAKAILTVDLETRTEVAQTPVGGTPAQVYVAKDGRVFATIRDQDRLAVFEAQALGAPLVQRCSVETPAEPIGVAASEDDATIAITAGWGQKVAAYDGATLAKKLEASVGREPRSIVVSDDGKTAFVSHAVGSVMSVVDLAGAKHDVKQLSMRGSEAGAARMLAMRKRQVERMAQRSPEMAKNLLDDLKEETARLGKGTPSCQGFALVKSKAAPGRVFAPQVFVDPGDPEARPDGYGDESRPTESPSIAVVDEGASQPIEASLVTNRLALMTKMSASDQRDPRPDCLLPRAAAVDPHSKALLVTCYGIDAVVAYDATSGTPQTSERRRWTVGSGPSGIAVDAEKRRAVVWSQFDRTISTFNIGGTELVDEKAAPPLVQRTAMAPLAQKLSPDYALGRILFHAAGDLRISGDGRACASCHPDGRDDAITWATPEGPRRSIMLAGRAAKAPPYSWNGNETTIHNHLGNTFDRLSGKGLRSIELDALVTYITSMPAPRAGAASADKAKVERGAQIFASQEAGCASCHSGAMFTDGRNHDVGSKHKADRSSAFNTPSLHLVGGTGPYFHDGRFATLSELLRKSDGPMGRAKNLPTADLDALEAYLRTL